MRKWLFEKIFSRWIPFKWIDGHKTDIARIAAFIAAVMLVGGEHFPDYVPILDEAQSLLIVVLSLLGIELGKIHKEDKEQNNQP